MSANRSHRKLAKYIRENDISKFKSYVRKHNIDVKSEKLEHGNSLLHVACEFGSDVIVRFLLRCGASLMERNDNGQVPLHLACYHTLEGHTYAEVDLVSPLITRCPASLDVRDASGVTPRILKGRITDLWNQDKPQHKSQEFIQNEVCDSSEEEDEEDEEEEVSWSKKISEEMQNEFDDSIGYQFNVGEDEEDVYETYDQWADRMAREHRARHKRDDMRSSSSSHKRRGAPVDAGECKNPKVSDEKKRQFDKNTDLEEERSRLLRLTAAKENYERNCDELFKPRDSPARVRKTNLGKVIDREARSGDTLLGFDDIPWPHAPGHGPESVEKFLLSDLKRGSAEYRSYLKRQQVRWHPDRFLQRCGRRLVLSQRQRILEKVNAVSQILNSLVESAR